jgi:hypothetical protein
MAMNIETVGVAENSEWIHIAVDSAMTPRSVVGG